MKPSPERKCLVCGSRDIIMLRVGVFECIECGSKYDDHMAIEDYVDYYENMHED